jgi:hypothetical protein
MHTVAKAAIPMANQYAAMVAAGMAESMMCGGQCLVMSRPRGTSQDVSVTIQEHTVVTRAPARRFLVSGEGRRAGYHIGMDGPPTPPKWPSASISLCAAAPRMSGGTFSSTAPIQ